MDIAGRWTVGHGTRGHRCLAKLRYSRAVASRSDWSVRRKVEWFGSVGALSDFSTSKSTHTCSSGLGRWCPDPERSRSISEGHGAIGWAWCSGVVCEWILFVSLNGQPNLLVQVLLRRLYSCVIAKRICEVVLLVPSHSCTSSATCGCCTRCKFGMELSYWSQTQSWRSRSRPCRY